jgi:uncharacterized coiled-coil DUF342 family protein
MAGSHLSVERQLARVSRRLFLQTILDLLVWCWAGALVVAAGWFLIQPFALESPPAWLRWAVAGGLVGAATLLAVVLAVFRAPSRLAAALLVDERFGLKERVTTTFTLTPEQMGSPAGQALLADVQQRVGRLDVAERFPLALSRSAVAVPVCALLLACVAFFYEPPQGQATVALDGSKEPPANAAAIEQKMKELAKKKAEPRPASKPKSEELEKLEAKLDEIANKPRQTKDQLRERIKEMTSLEDMMKRRERELAEKTQALKNQLKQLDRLGMKEGLQEGPAKDLAKALAEGNMDKAQEEIEKLIKKMKENQLSDKERKQLTKQLKSLQQQLKDSAEHKKKEERLKQLAKEGKLDAETLKRELAKLKQDSQKMKELQDLAAKLGACQKCLEQGDAKGASQKLRAAADQLKDLDLDDEELKDVRQQLQRLQDAKDCACQGMEPGQRPGGKRPVADEGPFKSFESRNKTQFDAKGKKVFDGYAPGQNFKKKSSAEISGEIQQAQQEAPEAIEQQRIPKAARDMAKEYFRNLGGQGDKKGRRD